MPKRARPGSVVQGPLYFLAGKHPRSTSGTQAGPGRAWLGPEPSCCRAQRPTTSLCSARLGQDGLRLCAHMCTQPKRGLPVHATPTRRLLPITHRVSAGTGARFFRIVLTSPATSTCRQRQQACTVHGPAARLTTCFALSAVTFVLLPSARLPACEDLSR